MTNVKEMLNGFNPENVYQMNDAELIAKCDDLICMTENEPELINDISHAFVKAFSPYERLSRVLSHTEDIKQTELLLNVWKLAIKSDNNMSFAAYGRLYEVAAKRPELSSDILDLTEIALQSDENDNYYFRKASMTLRKCLENDTTLADKVLNIVDKGYKHTDKGNVCFLDEEDQIIPIINKCSLMPELLDKCLPLYKQEFQCPNARADSLSRAFRHFGSKRGYSLLKSYPERGEELLNLCRIGIESKQNDDSSFHSANSFLNNLN